MKTERIGLVGAGRMGANMARRLRDRGWTLSAVCDSKFKSAQALAKEVGARAVRTPAEVAAASESVLTVVSDDAAMREIFQESPKGLLRHAQGRLFINCATVSPVVHREIERIAKRLGALSLEACMASSIPQAREGSLYLMTGGSAKALQRARPILEDLSCSMRHIGPAGSAATVKALVNLVMNINTAALAEGLGLGAALGLDLTALREVFSQTGAASRVLTTDGEDMQNREHSCFFSAAHAAKDTRIALELAAVFGLDLPLATATLGQFQRMIALGLGDLDKSGIAELTFPGRATQPRVSPAAPRRVRSKAKR